MIFSLSHQNSHWNGLRPLERIRLSLTFPQAHEANAHIKKIIFFFDVGLELKALTL